ncbi:Mitochondrial amidoxime-reducing component 1 [Pseudolycoriella hygida]|uniref:Mitochondrial amidoxime-reducing component 1 n=1 Tax=Pseudolycoriella hygida TaxID=35572 RepID=A0A9Q0MN29_9DIPT|nr:Mitochondrial amidoxime-reducing component 1 [Pseudolycoriella hygida]
MPSYALWRFGLIGLSGVTIYVFLSWIKLKKASKGNRKTFRTRSELSKPQWIKVGQVKELYLYPLKSGRRKEVKECDFTEFGIAFREDDLFTLRDRMFLVYNEESGKFATGKNYPKLVLVNLRAASKFHVRLEASETQSLEFEVPLKGKPKVNCTMWFDEPLKCHDCGDAPAEWISMFLTGKKSGLRIGFTTYQKRNLYEGPWEKFTKVYTTLKNDDTGLFADITSYMLTTESSLNELNSKLQSPVTSLQFRPNIVVSGSDPFSEDKWEWIKLGESVVIRNVKPCPRCAVIRIDPETGNTDDEALKCLRKFRAQDDPKKISVDGTAPIFGIYCGLYAIGKVGVGDDVYVHME